MRLTLKTLLIQQSFQFNTMFLEKQPHVMLQVDDMTSCNISGLVFLFHFLQHGSKHLLVAHHNEQLPLYAAIRAAKDPSKISHAISAHNDFVHLWFGAECGIWQTFLLGLQLLSCRVSCRRFDRFHFTLSHWQRCYKQVQVTKRYMKVKKTASGER